MGGDEELKKSDANEVKHIWLETTRVIVPLLWFAFAVIAFVLLFPLAKALLTDGNINNIKVGIIEVQLRQVTATVTTNSVELAKADIFIPEEKRKQIASRFARMSDNTKGATILWVDDNHPYQNVTERRVLIAANIYVDTANSTKEAFDWLSRSRYDIIITDMSRDKDTAGPCLSGLSNAGCALLKKVGDCFHASHEQTLDPNCPSVVTMQQRQLPALLVYSANYPQNLGAPYGARITNRAEELFRFVLDALEQRPLPVSK